MKWSLKCETALVAEIRETRQHFFYFFTIFLSGSSKQQVPRSSIPRPAPAQRFGAPVPFDSFAEKLFGNSHFRCLWKFRESLENLASFGVSSASCLCSQNGRFAAGVNDPGYR
jgi:hypothetical protein